MINNPKRQRFVWDISLDILLQNILGGGKGWNAMQVDRYIIVTLIVYLAISAFSGLINPMIHDVGLSSMLEAVTVFTVLLALSILICALSPFKIRIKNTVYKLTLKP